ncbi:hypothetical protein AWE51_23565 [Aquimarina aggregata]|uniref:Lipocalin-like domain-containing protein n=1 Tax=Aquimarina aggregata TaxID=1642818 RepID=A0A163B890_9FLAO|nr:lipocalin family protein [Aquimarina aggregata]KZS41131.1 hypothetical protein AWE51_23565 [Aquimarina aggregata]
MIRTILTTLVFIFSIHYGNAQKIDKKDLLKNWHLYAYKIKNKEYSPSKKEKNDYIFFKDDMTYTSLSEGKKEYGAWIFNTNGGYIMMNDQKKEKVKAYIISLTSKTLVLRFDIDEIRALEVHYTSIL